MLGFAEDYLGRIRAATSDHDIIAILARLAGDLGFRSGYLIEYASSLKSAVRVLDSNAGRAGWWDHYISSGLRTSTQPIADILDKGGVQYFDGLRFADPRDPLLAFARRVDMVDAALVPMSFDSEVIGLIGLSGATRLNAEQERALQFVGYTLFSQARSFHVSGIKTAGAGLTPREREVMVLSAEGLTAQQVADELGMSPRTVNQHMDNVAGKLGTKNRVHTVAEAIRRELF
ncbi:DNA-binding transcriptional regulator, CsgD family [Devosia sp. YR412]|uniref:helix-turn-helix transcriptional regulator n=1 Tax=Devosia sp. YR412 TaxID=1881030 RepID=UPI0008B94178|nr:helix-turn-helix transcriptional regulator [Devosia sp. YR412]SEP65216.1 DNA-binding transcriptional regulator, CsgD family [Devosia sp. YR412]